MPKYFQGFPRAVIFYCVGAMLITYCIFGLGIKISFNMGGIISIGLGRNISSELSTDSGYLIPFVTWAWVPVSALALIRYKICAVAAWLLALIIFFASSAKLLVSTEYFVVQQTRNDRPFQYQLSFTYDIYDMFTNPSGKELVSDPEVLASIDSSNNFMGGDGVEIKQSLGSTASFDIFPLLCLLIGLKLRRISSTNDWYGI